MASRSSRVGRLLLRIVAASLALVACLVIVTEAFGCGRSRTPRHVDAELRSRLEQILRSPDLPMVVPSTCEEVVENVVRGIDGLIAVQSLDGSNLTVCWIRAGCFRSNGLWVVWDQLPALPREGQLRVMLCDIVNHGSRILAQTSLPRDWAPGTHKAVFPSEFVSAVGDDIIHIYVASCSKAIRWATASLGAQCIYRVDVKNGIVDVLPLDFFNRGFNDEDDFLDWLFYDPLFECFFGVGARHPMVVIDKNGRRARGL